MKRKGSRMKACVIFHAPSSSAGYFVFISYIYACEKDVSEFLASWFCLVFFKWGITEFHLPMYQIHMWTIYQCSHKQRNVMGSKLGMTYLLLQLTLKYPPWYKVSGGPKIATSHSNKLSSLTSFTRNPSTGSSCKLLYSNARARRALLVGCWAILIWPQVCAIVQCKYNTIRRYA